MKRDIFSFGKAEEDARLAPCYDDNAARRKKSRFKAWFGFDALAYRAGWDISRAPLVANCCLAVVLVFVGIFVFRESVTVKQIVGMAVCIAGLVIVTV